MMPGEGDPDSDSGSESASDAEGTSGESGGGSTDDAGPQTETGQEDAETPARTPEDDLLDDSPNAEHLGSLTLTQVLVGEEEFLAWVADEFAERQRGLMFVTEEELLPTPDGRRRGMLFVFPGETLTGFWMRDTITALDVAYIRTDGTIDSIRTMTPLDETSYPPDGPYRYALEVPAGTFAVLGVQPGDPVGLPREYVD